jgi:cytochrome c oxidase subunit II
MFTGPADTSVKVEEAFFYTVAICVVLLALVTAFMIYFVVRYNRKRHPNPEKVEEKVWLEVIWTVIPIMIAISMFYFGWVNFEYIRAPAKDALTVNVMARKWTWLFTYDNGKQSVNLRVPLNKQVKLAMKSADVIHSLYIPAFRVKEDVVPGMTTYLTFRATEPGTYDLFCTEYCGLGHSHMRSEVIVMPASEFERWLTSSETGKLAAKGLKTLETKGCAGCHSIDGSKKIGPTFKGLYGSKETVIENGKEWQIMVDEAYIKAFVHNPNMYIVKGYQPVMPVIPVTDEEMNDIVEYIKVLK